MTCVQARRCSAGLLAVVFLTGAWMQAPPAKPQTATEFYLKYQADFAKAKKFEDLYPYFAAARRKEMEAASPAEREQGFGMMKILGSYTDIKVLKEDRNADGSVTLTVSGIDTDKKKASGKIQILQESGAWKVGEENWSS